MRVALISPYLDIYSNGLRMVSSCLKKAGHETKLILLPSSSEKFGEEYPECGEPSEEYDAIVDDVNASSNSHDIVSYGRRLLDAMSMGGSNELGWHPCTRMGP